MSTDVSLEIKAEKTIKGWLIDWRAIKNKSQENNEILGFGWVDKHRAEEEGVDKNQSEFSQQV